MKTIGDWSDRDLLICLTSLAAAIRLYLVLTSFCISGDGPQYLAMARDFSAGQYANALAPVFSPLYPFLISIVQRLVTDWEICGQTVSLFFGTATVPIVFMLFMAVYNRRDVAIGAAALTTIHPELAEFSASVRTEAGFIFLMLSGVYLLLSAIRPPQPQRPWRIAAAGLVGAAAYLYRTEAVGLPIVIGAVLLLGPAIWKELNFKSAFIAFLIFAATFFLGAAPYLIYLRVSTGQWTVGRELIAAVGFGIGDAAGNKEAWRALAWSSRASVLSTLLASPSLYVKKVATDFLQSFYYFAQAIGFFLSAFLLIGWWKRRRELLTNWREMLLALLIGFYFLGFALTYTGERFMVHLIPYSFGWVAFAALAADQWLRDALVSVRMRPVLVLIAIVLLPQTLWPLGYDLRGFRYAGIDIARRDSASKAVVASDGRAAFYASTPHILLPVMNAASLCRWLTTEPDAGFVLVTRREESTMGNLRDLSCLQFVNRYPRSRSGYYDLFVIRRPSPSRPRE